MVPYEDLEQQAFADWLDRHDFLWEYTPMDGSRTNQSGMRMKRMGAKKGSSDSKIFDRVPGRPEIRGIAIEMKRVKYGKESEPQRKRREKMTKEGWLCFVCKGAEAAINIMQALFPRTRHVAT